MYHDLGRDHDDLTVWQTVRVGEFQRQLDYLRTEYELVSLDDVWQQDRLKTSSNRPLAVITFDDGLRGNAEHLGPLVRREGVPVTIYVATRAVESGTVHWCDRIVNALQVPHPVTIDLQAFGLGRFELNRGRGAARWAGIQHLLDTVKHRWGARGAEVAEVVERQVPTRPGVPALAPLTVDEVRELAANPYVTIGSHTHGHELLTQLADEEIRATVQRSVDLLTAWTGRPVRHFCYPNGSYDPRVARIVAELGFATATTVEKGIWRPGVSPFTVPRIPVSRFDSLARFQLEAVLGLGSYHRHLLAGTRTAARPDIGDPAAVALGRPSWA